MTGVSKYCEEDAVKQALCSSNSMTLKSSSKKPSFLARCWRLIRHSTLKERFFILSLPLAVKESEGRQQPKETHKQSPHSQKDVNKKDVYLKWDVFSYFDSQF